MSLRALLRDATGTVRIPPGRYYEQLVLSGRKDLHIIATGVVLDGSRAPKGQSGLRLQRCKRITLEGLTATGWSQKAQTGGNGYFCTDCETLKVIDCRGIENGGSGLLTGGCRGVTVTRGEWSRNEGHGIYASNGGRDIVIERVICDTNERIGVHINGHPKRITNARVLDSVMSGNGNVPVQFAAVTNGLVSGCRGTRNKRPRVSFWDDGEGERFACRECREEGCSWA